MFDRQGVREAEVVFRDDVGIDPGHHTSLERRCSDAADLS
jgi:hypothetical protein